jgi:hypothetical protein
MPYFHIMTGLRGCYMPDNAFIIRAKTRRELKETLAYEAEKFREAGFIGANKKAIATIAATAWRNAKTKRDYLPYALPLAPAHAPRNYCHGIFVSNATRADYVAFVKESEQ